MDGQDAFSTHFLLQKEKEYIGTARYRESKFGIKLERFAIVKKYRNRTYGKVLLDAILHELQEDKNKLYLHAQDKAVNFYQRNGFEIIGDAFVEADILHYLMRYKH
jgi:predicted GNAT family N-acyltransferase